MKPCPTDYYIWPARRCYLCGRELPANSEWFAHDRRHGDNLSLDCRECRRERDRGVLHLPLRGLAKGGA